MLYAPRLPEAALTADEWAGAHRHLTFAVHDCEVHYLTSLALASPDELFAHMLLKKLKLAKKLSNDSAGTNLVRVNSEVEFIDGDGRRRSVTLRHSPPHYEPSAITIASLTGAGLIGLAEGQAILWPDESGIFRPLKVIRTAAPRAGRRANHA